MSTTTATRTFTATALKAELGRRVKNKRRKAKGEKAVKPSSWVFPHLTKVDIDKIVNGEIVEVKFGTGRVEHVGLK